MRTERTKNKHKKYGWQRGINKEKRKENKVKKKRKLKTKKEDRKISQNAKPVRLDSDTCSENGSTNLGRKV